MKKRARRIDGNQNEIVESLRKIPGISVAITSMIGNGFVDIVVGYKGINYLFEIKDPSQPPSKRVLTPDELYFHKNWHGQICVVKTLDEIINIIDLTK